MKKLSGLIAATHTGFKPDGSVDLDIISRQAELMVRQGVTGVYICGTTGEGISCSVDERKAIMEEWTRVARGKLFIIAHIGALALPDVQSLAAFAQKVACDAVSIVPANYFKPGNVETLVDYCCEALKTAPDVPFYYYHTGMSGINLSMVKFLEVADKKIPQLAGIKFNSVDLYEYQNCLSALDGKYDITYGVDEFFAGAVALGAKSAIGSTYNYMAPFYSKIVRDLSAGNLDQVQSAMQKVCKVVDILVQYGGVAAGKVMMMAHGLDLGDVRLPLRSISPEGKKDILERFEKLDVLGG
ncbi:MAG: dihydrodipicolinate synthase family protein [Planctomycetia bacterium]|nr:dihydrodipicolinate synthase family protein [Planctomycetia bacterium]